MSEFAAAESDAANLCDHLGQCPPQARGCRWVQVQRNYEHCSCGGWDERWVSRDGLVRLSGRSNHRRTCVTPLTERPSGGAE